MSRLDLSLIGIWLLGFSAAVIVVEAGVAAIWTLRLVRQGRRLSAQLTDGQRAVEADVARLRAAVADLQMLWQPYARVLRYTRHPLVIALLGSFARRRAGSS